MKTFELPNCHGYSLEFSPHDYKLLAIVSSKPFGSQGEGFLDLLEVLEDDSVNHICKFKWTDGLFDVVSKIELNLLNKST